MKTEGIMGFPQHWELVIAEFLDQSIIAVEVEQVKPGGKLATGHDTWRPLPY